MKLLHLTACDFMVYKDYKIDLKFVFPICEINLLIQHLTCSFINHRVTIHHGILLKSLPCELLHRIFHQLLIIYFLINGLLLSSRHCIQAGVSEIKIISLYIVMVSLMASSSSSFVFIQFRRGIFNFFASSDSDNLFIYFLFCNPKQVTKIFLAFFLHLKKFIIIIIITQHVTLLVFCISVFAIFNIYLRVKIFTLFSDRIDL